MTDQPFVPEVEDEDELDNNPPVSQQDVQQDVQQEQQQPVQDVEQEQQQPQSSQNSDFEQRFINDKWYGQFKSTQQLVQYVDNEWKSVNEDEYEFIQQLWMEAEAAEVQVVNGVKMKWNATSQQWETITAEIDEDFIAAYQSNYGVEYDYDQMSEEFHKQQEQKMKERAEKKEEKKKRKLPAEPDPVGWVEMDEKVNAVYVSNLPLDIDDEEFREFMAKAGVIQPDARNHKPKLKLYRAEDGGLKGDGRCCYVRKESVELALSILDGALLKGKDVKVEKAHFELKGEYDPSKKPKKMTAQQKKNYLERQKRIFEWKPDKPRNYRPLSDCTVIISNLFTIEELNRTPALLFDIKQDLETSCAKYGKVKKVVVYDNNPDGICSVTFENTMESDQAVKMLSGRVVKGRTLTAHLWDGKTRYRREETEEERRARETEWERFVGHNSDDEDEEAQDGEKREDESAEQKQVD